MSRNRRRPTLILAGSWGAIKAAPDLWTSLDELLHALTNIVPDMPLTHWLHELQWRLCQWAWGRRLK